MLFISAITFFTYFADKKKAVKHKWRVPEKVLLSLGVLGGALGAIIAMYTIRHKNRKWYFVIINSASLVVHIAILVALFLV
ncbi:MAG: DUF1294 domain-containing protein [Bacillota bacterium]